MAGAVRIARVELLRQWRSARSGTLSFGVVVIGFGLLILAANGLAALVGYAVGKSIETAPGDQLEVAREIAAVLWFLVFAVTAYRTIDRHTTLDGRDLLYTTVSRRTVLSGIAFGQFALLAGAVGPPVLVGAVALATGSGSLLAFPTVSAAGVWVLVVAYLAGFTTGLLVVSTAGSLPIAPKYRDVLVWIPVIVLLGIQLLGLGNRVIGGLSSILVWTPVGTYGDLAFVWTGRADPAAIIVALVFSIATLGTSLAVCSTLAHKVWTEREPVTRANSRRLSIPLIPIGGRPLWAVGTTAIRRSIRAPRAFVFLIVPALLFVEPIARVARSGTVQPSDSGLVLLYGTWIAGGMYALDPLGSEGPVLPVTLTADVGGETLIDGRAVAGTLIGGPPTIIGCLLVGFVSSLSGIETAVVVAVAAITCPTAPYLAAATGVAFPGRSERQLDGERTMTTPSKPAFVLFSMATVLVIGPVLWALATDTIAAVPAGVLTCAVAICTAAVARRYATWRIERYHL